MKQYKIFQQLLPVLFLAIPWLYLAFIWKDLPPVIPTHFGIDGTPDAFGKRNEIIVAPLIMTAVGLFQYFLLRNIYRIDPKKKYAATTSAALSRIALVVVVLLSAVSVFILYATVKGKVVGLSALFCMLSLFFAYLGNLMHSVKPNYFVGFRIPWALENEDNWRKTHQLAGKYWFIGGLVLSIVSLLLETKVLIVVFFCGVMIMTIIPIVYSYNIYRKMNKRN